MCFKSQLIRYARKVHIVNLDFISSEYKFMKKQMMLTLSVHLVLVESESLIGFLVSVHIPMFICVVTMFCMFLGLVLSADHCVVPVTIFYLRHQTYDEACTSHMTHVHIFTSVIKRILYFYLWHHAHNKVFYSQLYLRFPDLTQSLIIAKNTFSSK